MIPRAQRCLIACMTVTPALVASTRGDIVDLGPFVGEQSEDLENVVPPPGRIAERVDVFDGDVTFVSLVRNTTIHLWFGSCLNGNCAIPRSPVFLIGATTGQAIEFNTPARRFGAYFTNTSLADDFTAEFFDAEGIFLESRDVSLPWRDEDWHWLGWESDVPLGRIEIRSNGVLQGFIWLDDLELSTAGGSCDPCDMNCDGEINAFDIEPFLDLLFGLGEPCAPCTGDVNGDGVIDAFDIEPFLECVFP